MQASLFKYVHRCPSCFASVTDQTLLCRLMSLFHPCGRGVLSMERSTWRRSSKMYSVFSKLRMTGRRQQCRQSTSMIILYILPIYSHTAVLFLTSRTRQRAVEAKELCKLRSPTGPIRLTTYYASASFVGSKPSKSGTKSTMLVHQLRVRMVMHLLQVRPTNKVRSVAACPVPQRSHAMLQQRTSVEARQSPMLEDRQSCDARKRCFMTMTSQRYV